MSDYEGKSVYQLESEAGKHCANSKFKKCIDIYLLAREKKPMRYEVRYGMVWYPDCAITTSLKQCRLVPLVFHFNSIMLSFLVQFNTMWIILYHDQTYIGLASALRHAGEIEKAVEALEYAYDNVAHNSMVSESIVSILQDAANNDFKNKE